MIKFDSSYTSRLTSTHRKSSLKEYKNPRPFNPDYLYRVNNQNRDVLSKIKRFFKTLYTANKDLFKK